MRVSQEEAALSTKTGPEGSMALRNGTMSKDGKQCRMSEADRDLRREHWEMRYDSRYDRAMRATRGSWVYELVRG